MVKLLLICFILMSCVKDPKVIQKVIPSETVKLCFIGDTGTGSSLQKKVAAALLNEKCHSIHFVGDIIYPSGLSGDRDPQFDLKFMDIYRPHTLEDHKPDLYIIMGNHDYRGAVNFWRNIAKKHKKVIFPNPYYLVKLNNVCLNHLDTNYYRLFSNYILGLYQMLWMTSIEDEVKNCGLKIALTHHPFENKGEHHGSSSGFVRFFIQRYIIGKYDFLISGHEHVLADEGIIDRTRLLISGAGGKINKGQLPGYLVMEITGEKVDYNFRKVQLPE